MNWNNQEPTRPPEQSAGMQQAQTPPPGEGQLTDQPGFGPTAPGEVKMSSGGATLRCRDVTGAECGFEARRDRSPQTAAGSDVDQLLAGIMTHVAAAHPDRGIGLQQRTDLRKRLEGGAPRTDGPSQAPARAGSGPVNAP